MAWYYIVFQCLPILCRVFLIVVVCRSATDERCFILKMITKLCVVYLIFLFPIMVSMEWRKSQDAAGPILTFAEAGLFLATCGFSFRGSLVAQVGVCTWEEVFYGVFRCMQFPLG